MSMRDLRRTKRAPVTPDAPVAAPDGADVLAPSVVEPDIVDSTVSARVIPDATVERLATYLRVLTSLRDGGAQTISSAQLARAAGVNSALLRKDLSFLGSYGVRGVGYDVGTLTAQMQRVLGLTTDRAVVLIGIGNLGQALAGYAGFASRGFHVAALLDADPRRVGTRIHGHLVEDAGQLEAIVAERDISIAIVATPATVAQQVCDRIVAAGVTSILNFAPVVVSVPDHVDLRKVDLAGELQILSFHENRKDVTSVARGGEAQ
jgi:redox-sensing transcriptional repressor